MGKMQPWKLIALIILLCFAHVTEQFGEQCESVDIHLTHEDGSRQVFKLKQLEPTASDCPNCHQPDHHRFGPMTRSVELVPAMQAEVAQLSGECEHSHGDIPFGLCMLPLSKVEMPRPLQDGKSINRELLMNYAIAITERGLVPMATGNTKIDKKIAYGVVLVNTGFHEEAINHFTSVLKEQPRLVAAYHGRGAAYARKGLQLTANAAEAIADFSQAILLDNNIAESFERRAEVWMSLGRNVEAITDLSKAIKLKPNVPRLYLLRGTIRLGSEDLAGAEADFRQSAKMENHKHQVLALYNLGLALYYRGKIRNSIEVFKDVLRKKPDHVEARCSLGQAYRELGRVKKALPEFNKSLQYSQNHLHTLQLRGSMFYYMGNLKGALQDLNKCLARRPYNQLCQYLQGLSYMAMGRFYDGIKSHTKVMVYHRPVATMRVTPEFLKAHYLREYSRYLHAHLDAPLSQVDLDRDLNKEFKYHWAKLLPFHFEDNYKEQPGLQPHVSDVKEMQWGQLHHTAQQLMCRAEKVGKLVAVDADGFLPNQRLKMAMGLAAIHISQTMEDIWKDPRNRSNGNRFNWRDLFNIAVQYRRLVDLESPVFWLDLMPDGVGREGYKTDINFIKGHSENVKFMQYFDLVFKLMKTMVEHYTGDGVANYKGFKRELKNAKNCEDLLQIAKKRNINQQGFMVSTQVPSMKEKDKLRHEGVILTLTGDHKDRVLFSMNQATTKARTSSYHMELDFVYNKLYEEIRKTGVSKLADVDSITNLIISLMYYFYNLMPLSRGSSVVAYTVAVGLLMSIGKEVTEKLPPGKLPDVEAMLAGAPDIFGLVVQSWMNIKQLNTPVSSLPKVGQTLPTLRSILEVLTISTPLPC